jgi:7tm Odorant receptor
LFSFLFYAENQSDEIVVAIYDINWYLIPVSEQKKICLVLKRAQISMVFLIAGLFKLNVETCVEVMKPVEVFGGYFLYEGFVILVDTEENLLVLHASYEIERMRRKEQPQKEVFNFFKILNYNHMTHIV